MSNLLATLQAAGSVKLAATLDKSAFFNDRDEVTTDLPILNVAFSGDIDGGFTPGLTILAGASKSFKTMLSLYCMKAYLNKYPDAVCLFYDSEFGSNPEHMVRFGIDTSRVIHIPIEHVEQLKFDIVKRLEQVKKGDKVFILVDSLGNLASKKEVEDAENEKSVADMSRAKAIRSMLRIITPHLTMKDLPCFIINHVYETMEMYSKTVIPGGTAVTYAANQIFVITKSQDKDEKTKQILGWHFTINIEKSRRVKERSKLSFTVNYEKGIRRDSGMLDLAIEAGLVLQSGAWYTLVDPDTGELAEKKVRSSEIVGPVLGKLVRSSTFKDYVKKKFELTGDLIQTDEGETIEDLALDDI